jgi:hypothetical protein
MPVGDAKASPVHREHSRDTRTAGTSAGLSLTRGRGPQTPAAPRQRRSDVLRVQALRGLVAPSYDRGPRGMSTEAASATTGNASASTSKPSLRRTRSLCVRGQPCARGALGPAVWPRSLHHDFDSIVEKSLAAVAGQSLAVYQLEGSASAVKALDNEEYPGTGLRDRRSLLLSRHFCARRLREALRHTTCRSRHSTPSCCASGTTPI